MLHKTGGMRGYHIGRPTAISAVPTPHWRAMRFDTARPRRPPRSIRRRPRRRSGSS